jgi:hypothetical protein
LSRLLKSYGSHHSFHYLTERAAELHEREKGADFGFPHRADFVAAVDAIFKPRSLAAGG